ncbi:TniQ family protein [Ferrovibrio terrae]|uniref:TniQ family protein n=1 Tax=Ferrovibrio terrae TaxID=2594003 RepID=UPI003137C90B
MQSDERLPIVVPPQPDETLPSWLARIGRYYGISGSNFLDFIAKKFRISSPTVDAIPQPWRRKLDLFPSFAAITAEQVEALGSFVGGDAARIRSMAAVCRNSRTYPSLVRPDHPDPLVCHLCLNEMVRAHGYIYERSLWRDSTRFSCNAHRIFLTRSRRFFDRCGTKDCVGGGLLAARSFAEANGRLDERQSPLLSSSGNCLADFCASDQELTGRFKCTEASLSAMRTDLIWLDMHSRRRTKRLLGWSQPALLRAERGLLINNVYSYEVDALEKTIPIVARCLSGDAVELNSLFTDVVHRFIFNATLVANPKILKQRIRDAKAQAWPLARDWPYLWRVQFLDAVNRANIIRKSKYHYDWRAKARRLRPPTFRT